MHRHVTLSAFCIFVTRIEQNAEPTRLVWLHASTRAVRPPGVRSDTPTRIARPAVVSFPTFARDAGMTAVW
ncbi:hypothetical protein A5N78_13640 [Prescottella equi]|nr:hypothetical protein C7H75_23630 [Prescottella equi]OQQ30257.1 hypothetical protein A6410_09850 [Prescottella equi]ORJ97354.1 hypothetical protein A6F56_15110 [Prescottella equi]ORL04563.1 hypothetical protein A6F55_07275 [Prescottella equi]ORL07412.1 hypothetical protein A6I84_14255 [Prescottella equi]